MGRRELGGIGRVRSGKKGFDLLCVLGVGEYGVIRGGDSGLYPLSVVGMDFT